MTQPSVRPATVPSQRSGDRSWRPARVVVGVDGTTANWAAVQWAAIEARRVGCPLVLLGSGSEDSPPPTPAGVSTEQGRFEDLTRELLEQIRTRLAGEQQVDLVVGHGEPSQALVRAVGDQDLLVVGKRSGHPLARTVLGSTSIAVAGRSSVPVVVVPEGWAAVEHRAEPVVVGLDVDHDETALGVAFARADDLGVALVVVSSWDLPAPQTRSSEAVDGFSRQAQERLDAVLVTWKQRYPGVGVRTEARYLDPAVALSGAVASARLLVMGRSTGPHHPGGLRLGSTTRRVLRHATCPVLVVPSGPVTGTDDPDDTAPD